MLGRNVSEKTRALLAAAFTGKERPKHVKKILAANYEKTREQLAEWRNSEAAADSLRDKAQPKAKLWHASPEGSEWHAKHGAESWNERKWFEKSCQHCGRLFKTPYPTRAKFCHLNCKMAALRKRRGIKPRGPRVVPAIEGKRKAED